MAARSRTTPAAGAVGDVPWQAFEDAAVAEHGEWARTIVDVLKRGYQLGYEEGVRAAEGGEGE
jgi:hypothetical protein